MIKTPSPDNPTFTFTCHPTTSAFAVPYKTHLTTLSNRTSTHPVNVTPRWIAVGALTFDAHDRILLIQRSATDTMPNLWEIPGGGCDEEDASILYSVARELHEEAGLMAKVIGPQVNEGYTFPTRSGKIVCKYNFLVEVEEPEAGESNDGLNEDGGGKRELKVKLDPKEHQNYVWATEEDVKNFRAGDVELKFTSSGQYQVIVDAFVARRILKVKEPEEAEGKIQAEKAVETEEAERAVSESRRG
ncbi:hypothetical protein H2198_006394 [Neophaeococcomyces mojaviensis]|uniref:Uncharacterized protein n=1 Tax=Neophaeococcomyces mojaviensis TaxID=3383035 RepID=A0ACC3A3D9_9EURO|nr:hypothetical protein H2198_006394 [Knufia sp. JES_112]